MSHMISYKFTLVLRVSSEVIRMTHKSPLRAGIIHKHMTWAFYCTAACENELGVILGLKSYDF